VNLQFDAAWELHQFFSAKGIPYAIVGGIAVGVWGEPRFTQDVDVTVLVPPGEESEVIGEILSHFTPRMADAKEFALKHRVLLVKSKRGCDVDISFGLPGYEEEVIRRAVDYEIEEGKRVKVCCAEDLIIHKAISGRPQDWGDIEGIMIRQGERLDLNYIERWLEEFSQALARKDILDDFRKVVQRAGEFTREG